MYVATAVHIHINECWLNIKVFIPDTALGHHRPEGLHFRLPRLSTKLDVKWKNLVLWIGRLSVPDAVDEVFRHGEDVNPL